MLAQEALKVKNAFSIPNYHALPPLKDDPADMVSPLEVQHFKLTVPDTVGKQLLIRESEVCNLLASKTTKERVQEKIRIFNEKFNPSGKMWHPEVPGNGKRDALEAGLADHRIVKLCKLAHDPADVMSLDSSAKIFKTTINDVRAVVLKGDLFLTADKDMIIPCDVPIIQMGFGNWLDGAQIPLAKKACSENSSLFLIPFKILTDTDLCMVNPKGINQVKSGATPFPETPQPVWKMLTYLEELGVVDAKIVQHNVTRKSSESPSSSSERAHYKIIQMQEVFFKPTQTEASLQTHWVLQIEPKRIEASLCLQYMIKLEPLLNRYVSFPFYPSEITTTTTTSILLSPSSQYNQVHEVYNAKC